MEHHWVKRKGIGSAAMKECQKHRQIQLMGDLLPVAPQETLMERHLVQ